jgi:cAMP-dependent protein kinase regulator
VDNIVLIFRLLLSEKKLLFIHDDYTELTNITNSFISLLYPFQWIHTYIPIMSAEMLKYLETFLPFLSGIHVSLMNLVEKVFKEGDPPTYLKTYHPGESFGELALLYNAPRAATIRAKTDAICWALDRECFNNIVKNAAVKKREKYESTLKKVEILKTMEDYEIGQICDALKIKNFKKGDCIIKQGDKGNDFYILDEGCAHAEKVFEEGKPAQSVKDYKSGDYFGELALLKGEPRAASIVADANCKCLSLDRMAFKRLLGPLEDILQRNSESYVKFMKQ